MRGGPGQPFLRNLLQGLQESREVWALVWVVQPALHQNILHISVGLQVGETRLHAPPGLPDNRLWRLLFPRPLAGQQLVPHGAEGVHVAGAREREVLAARLLDHAQLADEFWRQIAQPTCGDGHVLLAGGMTSCGFTYKRKKSGFRKAMLNTNYYFGEIKPYLKMDKNVLMTNLKLTYIVGKFTVYVTLR